MKTIYTLIIVMALAAPGVASAGTGFFVGFSEDRPKWTGSAAVTPAADLGAKALRITVPWTAGQTQLDSTTTTELNLAVGSAAAMRIVISVFGAPTAAPLDDASREAYCTYVGNILQAYPSINDVVIWNESNKQFFWRPQFDPDGSSAAPAAYEALLARCWDLLHAARPGVNVIGFATAPRGNDDPNAVSNVSHSPANFIRKVGDAYRASGRALPILDSVGHHVHPNHSQERPWKQHLAAIALGDWDNLMRALADAFGGTGQPLPGKCISFRCVAIWYLELGYQTTIDPAKSGLYTGGELDPRPVPDNIGGEPAAPSPGVESFAPDQATQFLDSVRLAYCQPYVASLFNFLLIDEVGLAGWQSGPMWADSTPKDSYGTLKAVIGEANRRTVNCGALRSYRPYRDVVLADSPLAYWRLGDAGAAAADDAGEAVGTYAGATTGSPGALPADPNTAAAFDGVDDEIDLGDRFAFAATAPFTVEAWVFPTVSTPAGVERRIISKEQATPTADGWALGTKGNGITFTRWQGGAVSTVTTGPIAINAWTHVAAIYDGATMRVYLTAIDKGSTASALAVQPHAAPLKIGRRSDGTLPFAGRIDEVALYGAALPLDRVKEHYTVGTKRVDLPSDTSAPQTAGGLGATSTKTSITVTWNATADDDVTGFDVYRSTTANGSFTKLTTSPLGATTYTDSGLGAGVTRYYKVRAVDTAGNVGALSSPVGATTLGSRPPRRPAARRH